MKKKIFIACGGVVLSALLFLTGCASKTVCDLCKEEKHCQTRTIMGEETQICDDCAEKLDELTNWMN